MMMKLLIFCDPGIDDAMALIYALLHPEIDVLGLVCSYGNVDKFTAAHNAAHILHLAGRMDIPIFNGAEMPVTGELATYYPEIHGDGGIGPIKVTKGDYQFRIRNLGEVFDLIETNDDLVIADLGRSTTLATCFLLNREAMGLVKELHIMGGAFMVPGNVTPVAEANFYGDPTSANLLLAHGKKVILTPLNVTQKAIITNDYAKALQYYTENKFKDMYLPIIKYYADAYTKLVPGMDGAPFHDLLTIYSAVHPKRMQYLAKKVHVVVEGKTRGKSFADFRHMDSDQESKHHIALGFDYDHFLQEVFQVLTRPI
ncbi:nucleoside hydrolase [Sutcliffiella horikoshii]|uniref:nucleoside hydrolase n=1 Tax=Sutcliffiella horikoshii TaxID=79883 RepID=UPI001F3AE4A8|nr:nucleoside hydrolase [Sutcliffiella horikoshii]MCG1020400.1 nucleoside hydrolase [Sutcliffiella horikoshii]